MKKKWTPSDKQLDVYVELLKSANKVRREILRRRKKQERNKSRNVTLPDIVVPKHIRIKQNVRSYRFKSFKDYQTKVREFKRIYGRGLDSFYKVHKKEFQSNLLLAIQGASENMGVYDLQPEGKGGYFSKEQIENADENIGGVMKLYNRINALPPERFADMYENGFMPYIRYLYREMIQGTSGTNISFVEEANEMFKLYKERVR